MRPDLKKAKMLDELAQQAADGGEPVVAEAFALMATCERQGYPGKAMRVFLPFVQQMALTKPPVTGFVLLFTYRLTMLATTLREVINV